MRMWNEILLDLWGLIWTALHTEKGVELLDELAQALGLPDFFPNVDGSRWDDNPQAAPEKPAAPKMPGTGIPKPPVQTFRPSPKPEPKK